MTRKRIAAIVEGQGEVDAVPALIRQWLTQNNLHARWQLVTEKAVCAKGQANLLAPLQPAFQRGVEYFVNAALRADPDFLLIVLDADDACRERARKNEQPLGAHVLERARAVAGHKEIGVVIADREFEAWFLHHRTAVVPTCPAAQAWQPTREIEAIRDCKKVLEGWLGSYAPTADQARLAKRLPLAEGAKSPSRSFQKLHKELSRLLP